MYQDEALALFFSSSTPRLPIDLRMGVRALVLMLMVFVLGACKKGVPEVTALRSLSGFSVDQTSVGVSSKTVPEFTVSGSCNSKSSEIQISTDAGATWKSALASSTSSSLNCTSAKTFSLSFKFTNNEFAPNLWSASNVYGSFLLRGSSSFGYTGEVKVEVVLGENSSLSISDGPTFDFGTVALAGATKSFTVTNLSSTVAITALTAGAFTSSAYGFFGGSYPGTGGTCGSTLAASGTCTLVVNFQPGAAGSWSDSLTLNFVAEGRALTSTRPMTGSASTSTTWQAEAYIKAANAEAADQFGGSVAIHGDTMVVGVQFEDSNQTTVTNGTTASSNNSADGAGAVYIYKRAGSAWVQEAYLKAPNAGALDGFGVSVAVDGDTVVVGASGEDSAQTSISNSSSASSDNSELSAGAVYVFSRTGTTWSQQAYLKASNAEALDMFGANVAISGDTVVVGALLEKSSQTTITSGVPASSNNSGSSVGAVYVFKRTAGATWVEEAYLKAQNAESNDNFGTAVAISGDTVVVGASGEDSNQTTITNGTTASADNSALSSGAVYVFKRTGTTWAQQAYLKTPNAEANDLFGSVVAISGDTVIVGAYSEDSGQTAITNGTSASADNTASNSGAAYVFKRTGTTWAQEAYLKSPNIEANDYFGVSLAIHGDTVVVGASGEDSSQNTIFNGTIGSAQNLAAESGAAYIFKRTGTTWVHEAYLKAPNAESNDYFGASVAINGDTVVVGASSEDSNQTSITNGTTASSDNSAPESGAAYVFKRGSVATWQAQAYVKASNADAADKFGVSVAISGDTVVVGATEEDSNQLTITNGTTASTDNSIPNAGAAYVFKRTGLTWAQEAYLKAPNLDTTDNFGISVAISGDTVVIGAFGEDSNQTTITNGTTASSSNSAVGSGAAYVFKRSGADWVQEAYLKAPNPELNDNFGSSVAISGDTIVVGAVGEDSNQTTINNGSGITDNDTAPGSGAAYVFKRDGFTWVYEAYLKAPNSQSDDTFGNAVAISGSTIIVAASGEDSNQTTITNSTTASSDNSVDGSGAAYIFKRTGTLWAQQAYLKASNAETVDIFGTSVAISGDSVVVGAASEDSNQTTITNGSAASSDNSASSSGAAYVFKRTGTTWAQEAFLKAPNAEALDYFGSSVAISGDSIVVGAMGEASNQTSITNGSGASSDNSVTSSGAVYVFKRTGTTWAPEAYVKAPNAGAGDYFGKVVGVSGDTVVVGAYFEDSEQRTISYGASASPDNNASNSGAAYIFQR